ncbi:MAG: D-isomer specific 2-hydroxyacid dehydrogenase family protein [Ilumatobacteraceae bacterium]
MPIASQHASIAVGPANCPDWILEAVRLGGASIVDPSEATGLIWGDAYDPAGLERLLDRSPSIRWVQLPFAGSENFMHLVNADRIWTSGKGVYSEPVAELVMGFLIGGLRHIVGYSRTNFWSEDHGRSLHNGRITILGGGGIATALVRQLKPFNCHVTVVRNEVQPMLGVEIVVTPDRLAETLPGADAVVIALALTPSSIGIIGKAELELMEPHAWLINVGRGRHVVTDDLVQALRNNQIGGAALDVTDPEPLPDDHPLWQLSNCVVTPHIGNTAEMVPPMLSERITANVKRYLAGEPLIGLLSEKRGY